MRCLWLGAELKSSPADTSTQVVRGLPLASGPRSTSSSELTISIVVRRDGLEKAVKAGLTKSAFRNYYGLKASSAVSKGAHFFPIFGVEGFVGLSIIH